MKSPLAARFSRRSRPCFPNSRVFSAAVLLTGGLGVSAANAQTITGTGYKGITNNGTANTGNWSASTNWDSTGPAANERNLFFGQAYKAAAGTNFISKNDIAGYSGYRITFQDSDATGTTTDGTSANDTAFTISGNGFTLFDFGSGNFPRIQNDSFLTQTFTLTSGQTIVLSGGVNNKAEINPVNADLVFSTGTGVDLAGGTQLQIFGNNGKNVTFNGVISSSGGANSVSINQNSTVIYGAANTYSGDTFINAGTLSFVSGTANNSTLRLGDTAANSAAATLNIGTAGGGTTVSSVINVRPSVSGTQGTRTISGTNTSGTNTYSGIVALDTVATITSTTSGGTLAFTGSSFQLKTFGALFNGSGNTTVSGPITSTGAGNALTKAGTGTLALSGTNTYDGATTISAGTLQLGNGGTTGTISTSSAIGAIASGATLAVNRSNAVVQGTDFSGAALTGAGGFTQAGAGITTLNATNTYTGSTTVSAGILRLANGAAIADTAAIANIASGGLLDLNGTSETVGSITAAPGSISLGGGTLTLASNNASSSTGLIYGTSSGALVKLGTNTLTLAAIQNSGNSFATGNLFGGGLTISGGTVTISAANSSGTGLVSLNTGGVALNISSPQFLLSGGITTNAGTTTLSAANAAGTGTVTLNTGGTLAITNTTAAQLASVVLNGGTFTPNASTTFGSLSGSLGFTAAAGTLTFGTNNTSGTYTGSIAGAVASNIVKSGSGTQILNGTNATTGTITANGSGGALEIGGAYGGVTSAIVNAGALRLNFNAAAAPSTNLLNSAATLKMNGGTLAIVGKDATSGISQTFASTDFGSASIFGAGTISVTNGTTGSTTALNLGGLTRFAGNGVNFVLPSGVQSATNGILTTTGTAGVILRDGSNRAYATVNGTDFAAKDPTTNNIVALPSYFTATSSSVGTTNSDNADIAGGVNPTIAASATTNTLRFSGPTASTLTINSGQIVTLNSGGILVSSAVTGTGSKITGAGSITAATGTAEVVLHQFSAQPFTLDAAITNANGGATATAFTKTGPGTLIVTKGSTNSGPTYVDSGVLQIGAGGSFASSVVTLAINDPTAVFNVNNQTTSVSNIDGGSTTGGYVNLGVSGTLNISGGNGSQFKGALVGGPDSAINKIGSGSQGFNGANNNAFYGTLTINSGNTVGSFAGGASAFANANVVNNGTYTVGNGPGVSLSFGSLSGSGTVSGASNAATAQTFNIGYLNRDTTFSGVINNGTGAGNTSLITKFGSGTTTFSGANTYTGNTQINTGGIIFDYTTVDPLSTGPLTVGGGTATFKAGAVTTDTTGAFGLTNNAQSKVVLNGGFTATLGTTTVNGVNTLASSTTSSNLLFDLSSSASNSLKTSSTIGAAVFTASDTTAIRVSNGVLATGGTGANNYRANVLIRDTGGYGFATTSGTNIVRYTGATPLLVTNTANTLAEDSTGNYKLSVNLTRTAAFLYNTLELDSSSQAVTLTDNTGNRFGNGSGSTSGRGVLATGTLGATITNSGGTNQPTYFNNYLTGGTLAGQTFTLNMPLAGTSYFNGLATNLTVATGIVNSSDQYFQSGVTRLTGAQVSGDALTAGSGVYRLNGGILEIGADLTGTLSATSGADFSRSVGNNAAGQVQLIGDTGFSAYTGTVNGVRTVNLGGAGQQVAWGVDNFLISTAGGDGNSAFRFSSAFADSTLDFQNPIALGTTTRNVDVANGGAAVDARLSGVISGVFDPTVTLANGAPATLNAAAGLTKLGAGTLELTAVDTYRGRTTVSAGTLSIFNSGGAGGRLTATNSIVVNAGGTLLLSGANNVTDRINDAATVTLAGGTLARGSGVSEMSVTGTAGFGALTLTANSTLDFGTGAAGTLVFSGYTPGGFTLSILNYNGTQGQLVGTNGTDERLIFLGDQFANLGAFAFNGGPAGANEIDLGNGYFEIIPVPEPGTVAASLLAFGTLGLSQRRRVRRWLGAARLMGKAA